MHERTQRAVARLLFVFCCAVPTSIVLTAILLTWTSWYQSRKLAEVTYRLGRETGLVFQIDRCRLIAPNTYVLENVRIDDPDSGRNVATIRMVDYFHGTDRVGIRLHQPELQSAGLGQAWSKLHDRLISCPAHTVVPIFIRAADLNIQSRTGSLPLADLWATITPEGKSVRMIAEAGDAAGGTGPRVRVDLFRDREGAIPATELVLSTEGTPLPCSALAEYAPAIRKLGPDAEFSGVVKCVESPDGWSFDLGTSSLTQMNLSFLTDDFPHRVVGKAELHLRRCLVHPGQTVNMNGVLHASGVRLKTPLLEAMRERLGMNIDDRELLPNANGIECKLAAIHFEITDETMNLTGICDDFHAGIGSNVALYARGRPIAWTRASRIDTEQVTAVLDPPSRTLAAWNQVFLPSSPVVSPSERPLGEIRRVKNWTGQDTIRQE